MNKIRVKPAEGVVVLESIGKPIPAKGKEVDKTVRILRAIREGALIVVKTLPKKEKDKEE
jgi:hypothetical protein